MKTTPTQNLPGIRQRGWVARVFLFALACNFSRGQTGAPAATSASASPAATASAPATATVPLATTALVPVPAPPLTAAQQAVLQGKFAAFVAQFAAGTGIKLVPIPAGTFLMGSPDDEADRNLVEGPQTKVTLTKDFFLGATDVTQGQYEAVMGQNPSGFKDAGKDAPVENVSWDDAMAFCQKLTAQERAAGRLPEGYVFTLPTEAQWEYACRAGTTGPFAGDLDAMAWYAKNSGGTTHPVGLKKPNAWGLYDMEGNVMQWCYDWYAVKYHGGEVADPKGPVEGFYRDARGGRWNDPAAMCRSAARSGASEGRVDHVIGFRVALSAGK